MAQDDNATILFTGYPIINDPLYNSAAFGPNRGKGGEFWKSDTEVGSNENTS